MNEIKRFFTLIILAVAMITANAQTAPANPVFVKYQGNIDNHTGVKQALVALPAASVATIYDDAVVQYNATTGLWEIKRDYRDWVVEITQTSTTAPTVVATIDNELGAAPVWTYTGVGVYTAELDDVFTDNLTFVQFDIGNATGLVPHAYSITDSTVVLKVFDAAGAPVNLVGTGYLHVRVKQ